ncbi:MAG TPA: DUF2062 domain-containing protein [Trichocoleus sp.]|jgi:uncharacterized protein (DUF2062 family)
MRWKRSLRYLYLRLLRLRDTPDQIAKGFAFGVFWGMFPLPGLQMAIAILTAALFRSSKIAAAAGTWLTNPITTLPFTALNFHIGQTVLGREWRDLPLGSLQSLQSFMELGTEFITAYLLGCAIVGFCGGTLSYIVGVPTVAYLKQRLDRRQRKQKRQKRWHQPSRF